MGKPLRHNKKQRKYYRKKAKALTKAADKLAVEGGQPEFVNVLRQLSDFNTKMSLAKRRKKKKLI